MRVHTPEQSQRRELDLLVEIATETNKDYSAQLGASNLEGLPLDSIGIELKETRTLLDRKAVEYRGFSFGPRLVRETEHTAARFTYSPKHPQEGYCEVDPAYKDRMEAVIKKYEQRSTTAINWDVYIKTLGASQTMSIGVNKKKISINL